jgi:predicted outer membrane repeat protein
MFSLQPAVAATKYRDPIECADRFSSRVFQRNSSAINGSAISANAVELRWSLSGANSVPVREGRTEARR